MQAMAALLNPRAVAVVGASQRPGRGTSILANLQSSGFKGGIYAVNPRYTEVLGAPCVPSVRELPATVDCIAVAVAADAACEVLEAAFAHGIRAAVVMAAGFGEGGHSDPRSERLRALGQQGMCICGPNCFGFVNARSGAAAFSGIIPKAMQPGPVALVSQSGSLGNFAFSPLMRDRALGFSYFVSCGNQIATTVEDYVEYFVADPEVKVIAAIVEDLKNPRKLLRVAAAARQQGKPVIFFQVGRSARGQVMIRSHTGALAGNAQVTAAFLARCGIIQADGYDEFVETIALYANLPPGANGDSVVLVSGSGGGAALAADHLEASGVPLADLAEPTRERIKATLPAFGSVTNPIDATGAMYDDTTLLPKLFDAIAGDPSKPIVAANVIAAPSEKMRRIAGAIADAAHTSGRTIVAYHPTALGPVDGEIVKTLNGAHVPLLMGIAPAMGAIKHLTRPRHDDARANEEITIPEPVTAPLPDDFLGVRDALAEHGVAVVDCARAGSADEAVTHWRRFGAPVALKAEAPGLLHKSELGCVRLNCAGANEVAQAYDAIITNARKGGFADADVLVQPMVSGLAEAYAGIINDPHYGPAVVFGLGGIFVEILKDTVTQMAPLTQAQALRMIERLKGAPILMGARGRPRADIDALAALLVSLGRFAVANYGRFRSLDLNPIIVKADGALAVDIAVEANP